MKGRFVIVEGLDSSGKGTILKGIEEWAVSNGLKTFNLSEYSKEHKKLPEPEEIAGFDAVRSDEPTYSYAGQAIREEIINSSSNRAYSALSAAQAFALDREILYRKVIIPALKAGKHVFQERGVTSSIVYQPVQGSMQLSEVLKLPGNKLAMQNAPDLLIITQVNPDFAMDRLGKREKKDSAIFENRLFQRKIIERYNSGWLRSLFEGHGSSVVYLDTNPPKTTEDIKKEAIKVWERLLEN